MKKDELLQKLPRWKTGKHAGEVRGTAMKELEAKITTLKFTDKDLDIIAAQLGLGGAHE